MYTFTYFHKLTVSDCETADYELGMVSELISVFGVYQKRSFLILILSGIHYEKYAIFISFIRKFKQSKVSFKYARYF